MQINLPNFLIFEDVYWFNNCSKSHLESVRSGRTVLGFVTPPPNFSLLRKGRLNLVGSCITLNGVSAMSESPEQPTEKTDGIRSIAKTERDPTVEALAAAEADKADESNVVRDLVVPQAQSESEDDVRSGFKRERDVDIKAIVEHPMNPTRLILTIPYNEQRKLCKG
jgi:hypothetical protein